MEQAELLRELNVRANEVEDIKKMGASLKRFDERMATEFPEGVEVVSRALANHSEDCIDLISRLTGLRISDIWKLLSELLGIGLPNASTWDTSLVLAFQEVIQRNNPGAPNQGV